MRKIIAMSLLVWAFVLPAFAAEPGAESGTAPYQTVRLGFDLDYNMVAMDQVNKQLSTGTEVTKISSGISGMLNLDVAMAPFIMLGVRGGLLSCQSGSATYDYIVFNQKVTIDSALVPLEVGLIANFDLPASPVSIMAAIYGGYGYAAASVKNEFSALGQTATVTQPFNGSGFVGEVIATVSLKLAVALSLNLNAGYRMANIAQMQQSQDVNYDGIPYVTIPAGKKGDVMKDADDKDIAFDFSGLHVGAGLSLGF